ncbi:MAG: hypothetical protein KAG10_00300 [Methylococcales bacterium]|nr:hypothetical protein [Methylococcales bacterium]MCK5924311.1 hypothetical protein [Methylococcales bacterium]
MSKNQANILQALNPADYFTLAMDEEIRHETGVGSLCGMALELDALPEITVLEDKIKALTQNFPIILTSLQQQGNRFHWCQRDTIDSIFFQYHATSTLDIEQIIANLMNQVQARETIMPLSFHLIHSDTRCVLLFRWMHPLCDAVSINLILQYLATDDKNQREKFHVPTPEALVTRQLNKFSLWKKIQLFLKAKRYITTLDQQQSIIHAAKKSPKKLRALHYQLSVEQSHKINQFAKTQTGITGSSLYYIGCFMRALEKMNPQQSGEAYCVPYAFNLRKQKALTPLLGNHVGVLFAQASRQLIANRKQLFTHLKQQNKTVIRQQLDYAFLPIMWAARFLSLKKHGENLRLSYTHKTERSSFWFSQVNLTARTSESLCNRKITGIRHFCQISSPPAIALLSCEYQQQLTLNYNFIEPLFEPAWIEKLHHYMLDELLTEDSP